MNQMENKKNNNNKNNSSNSLVFGRWPQTKISLLYKGRGLVRGARELTGGKVASYSSHLTSKKLVALGSIFLLYQTT